MTIGLVSRFTGALVGAAVGDALGAPFEGAHTVGADSLANLELEPGELRYTDDTALTFAVAESLVESGGFDGASMAKRLAAAYFSEPRRGYGESAPQVFRMLSEAERWDAPAQALFGGAGSFGNGAAMRVAPVALYSFSSVEATAELARNSARVTHAHPLGIEGAVLQAQAVAFILRTDPDSPLDIGAMLDCLRSSVTSHRLLAALDVIEGMLMLGASPAEVVQRLGNGAVAHRSVPTALFAFLSHSNSFPEAVLYAISLAGDTDTIASMTAALAGARLGDDAIPDTWSSRVEGGPKARSLAQALLCLAV